MFWCATRDADRNSILCTDESRFYTITGTEYAGHETVKHSAGEYARGIVHTNTIENVFSVFKRGTSASTSIAAKRTCTATLAEFDFRYNRRTALGMSDRERARRSHSRHQRQAPHLYSN